MDAEASPEAREKVKLFHEALDIFEAQDWTAAGAAFEKVLNHNPKDRPSKIYRERCAEYRKTLPAPNWDGVYNLSQK
jgi:adenylate cyclase